MLAKSSSCDNAIVKLGSFGVLPSSAGETASKQISLKKKAKQANKEGRLWSMNYSGVCGDEFSRWNAEEDPSCLKLSKPTISR